METQLTVRHTDSCRAGWEEREKGKQRMKTGKGGVKNSIMLVYDLLFAVRHLRLLFIEWQSVQGIYIHIISYRIYHWALNECNNLMKIIGYNRH